MLGLTINCFDSRNISGCVISSSGSECVCVVRHALLCICHHHGKNTHWPACYLRKMEDTRSRPGLTCSLESSLDQWILASRQMHEWELKKKKKTTKNCFWSHWVWLTYCAVWQWQQISDQKAISTSWTQTGKTNLIAYPLNSITRQRRIIYNNSRTQTLTTNSWKDIS